MSVDHQTRFYNNFKQYIESSNCHPRLKESIEYSFISNGKLIRPMMFYAVLSDLQVSGEYDNIAIAIEMIHTYSLIHDDLPAMDNDDMRRGKPTNHIEFGEDIAILAGDALLTQAFDLIAKCDLEPVVVVELLQAFTLAAGIDGMIGGQVLDVMNEGKTDLTEIELAQIHDLKTAMMIELPVKCAMIIARNINNQQLASIRKLGLLYQIQDDYLDLYGNPELMGKPAGSDGDKVTYCSFYSQAELEALIESMSEQILADFKNSPQVEKLIKTILKREG